MASPFFSTGFMDAVHASRGDVEVAVLRGDDDVIGYWPMHRINGVAKPVGRFINDAHNLIAAPGIQVDWRELLDACQVRAFDFHALVGDSTHLDQSMIYSHQESFAADIHRGGPCFVRSLEASHRTMRKQNQKTRKLQREHGPLRFEIDCRDRSVLETAMAWKRDQYRRTHILDLFLPRWTRSMVQQLHRSEDHRACRGLVSALWAGEHLVAAHIGMIEGKILHYWFPTYNESFSIYSPGTALFKMIASHGSDFGIEKIDMGYGAQPYKRKQTDVITTVATGCVTYCSRVRIARRLERVAMGWKENIPMREAVKRLMRGVKPDAGIGKLT